MPDFWVHVGIDLIAFGRLHFGLHKWKDKPSETLGRCHRARRHDWYQRFGKEWNLDEPFPNRLKHQVLSVGEKYDSSKAEKLMAYYAHDYMDRIWDELSPPERKYREGFFAWLLLNPTVLKEWAGVNVLQGEICRIIGSSEVWESWPQLKSEYKRLRRYVEAIIDRDETLASMIEGYGY